jgi:F-type H+-transporting ATPase subunit epsilon
MIFKVFTQQGKTYTDTITYAIVKNQDGEIGILKDHVPIIIQVREGFLKLVGDNQESYLVIEEAVVEFKDNELSILALEAQIGQTFEKAKAAFDKQKKEKLDFSKRENVDFSKQERELRENIKKSKAGQV